MLIWSLFWPLSQECFLSTQRIKLNLTCRQALQFSRKPSSQRKITFIILRPKILPPGICRKKAASKKTNHFKRLCSSRPGPKELFKGEFVWGNIFSRSFKWHSFMAVLEWPWVDVFSQFWLSSWGFKRLFFYRNYFIYSLCFEF